MACKPMKVVTLVALDPVFTSQVTVLAVCAVT